MNSSHDEEFGKYSKYKLLLCEYWWENRHGPVGLNIKDKLIVYQTLNRGDLFYDFRGFCQFLYSVKYHYKRMINILKENNPQYEHQIISNFVNIISCKNYMKPEICEIIHLNDRDTDENIDNNLFYYTTCIKKTCWLKIFQRKWKNYYKKKKMHYGNLNNILNRQIFGYVPFHY